MKKRIIPCLDVEEGKVVKGYQFTNIVDAGDPIHLARMYEKQGADEIVFLDITASYKNRSIIFKMIQDVAKEVFIPLTVGGGVRNIRDIEMLLNAGADKVAINTQAVENPNLIHEASRAFGSQCIVIAIDAKRKIDGWEVYTKGGRVPSGKDAIAWSLACQELGAGEILLTSIDSDGTKQGYDIPLIKSVRDAVSLPIIASGGVGKKDDFYKAFDEGKADAALAASVFHFGKYTIDEVKRSLEKKNIPVRRIKNDLP